MSLTSRATTIMDVEYKAANLPEVVEQCEYLASTEKNKLLRSAEIFTIFDLK